jgi:protein regulator of cytokinesis 1
VRVGVDGEDSCGNFQIAGCHDHVIYLFYAPRKLNVELSTVDTGCSSTMTSPSTAMTLTSLLNSLHTHLQSQTQLLPTLYAQLGLPPSALEDELKTLQQQLVHGVELQIDKRRKEVEYWMEKCDAIESECVRYSKALGGNIKATGTSVAELRKEQALPRRYEMISEYQEKLRQVSNILP